MKDTTFYFSHDYHARKDPKCIALIKDFGLTGYAVYWCIVEILYEQGGKIKKFPALYSALSFELGLEESDFTNIIEAMLHSYELLLCDDNYIWSESVLSRLAIREEKHNRKSEAGRLGGISSGESRRLKHNEATLRSNEANEPKERKVNKRKEKKLESADAPPAKSFKQWTDREFYEEIAKFKDNYSKDTLRAFYNYWSEKNAAGKMAFQLKDTWETKKRLVTWSSRDTNFERSPLAPVQQLDKLPSRLKKIN